MLRLVIALVIIIVFYVTFCLKVDTYDDGSTLYISYQQKEKNVIYEGTTPTPTSKKSGGLINGAHMRATGRYHN